jgi:hypothetical protein
MRIFILILICSVLLTSCSQVNECENRFDFISTNDSIPILELDYSEAPETTLERMNNLYGIDLCNKCDWVEFKSPFEIEGQKGYLKVIADFDSQYCPNCPIAMRLRNYFHILINSNNQILAEGELTTVKSLKTDIRSYLSKVGDDDNFPETYMRVHYSIQWDRNSDSTFIDSVITSIFTSHTDFVASKISEDRVTFCSLDKAELIKLKTQYPLRIQISSGKSIEMPSPIELNKILKEIDEVRVEPTNRE